MNAKALPVLLSLPILNLTHHKIVCVFPAFPLPSLLFLLTLLFLSIHLLHFYLDRSAPPG